MRELIPLVLLFSGVGCANSKPNTHAQSNRPDANQVLKVIESKRENIKTCFVNGARHDDKTASGRVEFIAVINDDGIVSKAAIKSTTLNHPKTEECIVRVVKGMTFPKMNPGGSVEISYPYVFKAR